MHTLFTLEDIYGLTVSKADGEVCLKVNKDKGREAYELIKMLYAWKEQADKLSSEEISREEYDTGVTIIQRSTPHNVGQKFHHRNSVTHS